MKMLFYLLPKSLSSSSETACRQLETWNSATTERCPPYHFRGGRCCKSRTTKVRGAVIAAQMLKPAPEPWRECFGLIVSSCAMVIAFALPNTQALAEDKLPEESTYILEETTLADDQILPLPKHEETAESANNTIILSDQLTLLQKEEGNEFLFEGNVSIRSGELTIKCDRMIVYTAASENRDEETIGFGAIQQIRAIDNVIIRQDSRLATADLAIILPDDGKIILEGQPVVTDERGSISGYRMILYEEERKVVVESGPEGEQPKVVLPRIDTFTDRPPNSVE